MCPGGQASSTLLLSLPTHTSILFSDMFEGKLCAYHRYLNEPSKYFLKVKTLLHAHSKQQQKPESWRYFLPAYLKFCFRNWSDSVFCNIFIFLVQSQPGVRGVVPLLASCMKHFCFIFLLSWHFNVQDSFWQFNISLFIFKLTFYLKHTFQNLSQRLEEMSTIKWERHYLL